MVRLVFAVVVFAGSFAHIIADEPEKVSVKIGDENVVFEISAEPEMQVEAREWTNEMGASLNAPARKIGRYKVTFWIDGRDVEYPVSKLSKSDRELAYSIWLAKTKYFEGKRLEEYKASIVRVEKKAAEELERRKEEERLELESDRSLATMYASTSSGSGYSDYDNGYSGFASNAPLASYDYSSVSRSTLHLPMGTSTSRGSSSSSTMNYNPSYRPSVGSHYVKPTVTRNGVYRQGHYRTNSDNSFWNNYSSNGNVNPKTGVVGTKLPPYRRSR